jgi:hypothetical protein
VRSSGRRPKELYLAPIARAGTPRQDARSEWFVRVEVTPAGLGIESLHLPAAAIRDYFYRAVGSDLYEVLSSSPTATAADLRLAYKVRQLELAGRSAPSQDLRDLERAFNLLMNPDLRACYDGLLLDPNGPALFPYGGFGSILTSGERTRDGKTFFARSILSFRPNIKRMCFRARFRSIDFQAGAALYRDPRRKVEIRFDPAVLRLPWDPTWNQWKHLVGLSVGVDALCVLSGGVSPSDRWWQALPSRLVVELPAETTERIETARATHRRLGQYSAALDRIRARIECEPVERTELELLCRKMGIPGDFDVGQISWQPDYDAFYYHWLRQRARRMFLYREEYLFELSRSVVVEVPKLGNATYVFARPDDLALFVRTYSQATKDDIRRNRERIAERLGFIDRVMHGRKQQTWARAMAARAGEELGVPTRP